MDWNINLAPRWEWKLDGDHHNHKLNLRAIPSRSDDSNFRLMDGGLFESGPRILVGQYTSEINIQSNHAFRSHQEKIAIPNQPPELPPPSHASHMLAVAADTIDVSFIAK